MKCKMCSKEFHNCASCDTNEFEPEYHGYCSDHCWEISFINNILPKLQTFLFNLDSNQIISLKEILEYDSEYENKIFEYIEEYIKN